LNLECWSRRGSEEAGEGGDCTGESVSVSGDYGGRGERARVGDSHKGFSHWAGIEITLWRLRQRIEFEVMMSTPLSKGARLDEAEKLVKF
jgi:hypothetical protein